ncbi:hypothetical protein HanIR_Chr13g0634961 [Helianthus annuus]|nr:hypothetical protein HanIR_Chr13g0634961 [Helianthus annuus]
MKVRWEVVKETEQPWRIEQNPRGFWCLILFGKVSNDDSKSEGMILSLAHVCYGNVLILLGFAGFNIKTRKK